MRNTATRRFICRWHWWHNHEPRALLKDKLGSAEHEEEEHEESGLSAMDSFLDALESGDRGAAKAALNAAFHEHMMAMEDEDEEDALRIAHQIAIKPKGDMHSHSKMKKSIFGSPMTKKERSMARKSDKGVLRKLNMMRKARK